MGRVKYSENPLTQYDSLIEQIKWAKDNIRRIVSRSVEKTPGMRMFLLSHSCFNRSSTRCGDWFVKMMIDYLNPTEEEIGRMSYTQSVPEKLMKQLEEFDPEPTGFQMEPVRVEYQLYGRKDPINIVDFGWESVKGREQVDIKQININTDPIFTYKPNDKPRIEIDDLPF